MSLAAVAVRNQRRRAAQQQHQLVDDLLTQNASDPNLKLRKVRQKISQVRSRISFFFIV